MNNKNGILGGKQAFSNKIKVRKAKKSKRNKKNKKNIRRV